MADLISQVNNSEESEDTLSLCDLSLNDDEFQPDLASHEFQPDLFEFSVNPNTEIINNSKIIFCGRSMISRSESKARSNSVRIPGSVKSVSGSGNFRYYGKSKQHKVFIGLGKFPTEMEMSDMRKRQSRNIPTPMFTAVDGGDKDGGHWGLIRILRSESHIGKAMAKASFGCFSVV